MSIHLRGPIQPQNENRLTNLGSSALSKLTAFGRRIEKLVRSAIQLVPTVKQLKIRAVKQEHANPNISKSANKALDNCRPQNVELNKAAPQHPEIPQPPLYEAYKKLVQVKLELDSSKKQSEFYQLKERAKEALNGIEEYKDVQTRFDSSQNKDDLLKNIQDFLYMTIEPELIKIAPNHSQSSDQKQINKMANALGLEGKEIEAFADLVKAQNHEKQEKMEALLSLNSDIKGAVRITFKNGIPKVRFIVAKAQKKAQLGAEGGFKACYKAIRVGGKFAEKMKMVVTYEKASHASQDNYLNDAKESVKISEELQNELNDDEKKLFIKYKLYNARETNRITAQFAEGGDISSIAHGLKNEALLKITHRLLKAGHAMERNNFSHNDLKFDNVFMKGGEVVIGDMGLMRRNCKNYVGGTPGYIPPDLLEGKKISEGTRHDNFSMGVMLLHMYTGKSYTDFFEGEPEQIRKNILCIQNALDQIQPQAPIFKVIRGLISADAKDRMTFQEALTTLEQNPKVKIPDQFSLNKKISTAINQSA